MMFLMRRRVVIVLILVAVTSALAMGAIGYLAVRQGLTSTDTAAKATAERVLFASILTVVVVLTVTGVALRDTRNINTILRRLVELNRLSGTQAEDAIRRLGEVGEHILNLYAQISSLSTHKSTRISAMNGLISAIIVRSEHRLLVVNAIGTVYRASPAALRLLEKSTAEVTGKPIDTLLTGESFTTTVAEIARTPELHTFPEGKTPVVVVPITNDQDLVAYYLYLLGDDARNEKNRTERIPATDSPSADAEDNDAGDQRNRLEKRNPLRRFYKK